MKKYTLIISIFAIILLLSCSRSRKSADQEQMASDTIAQSLQLPDMKTVSNERFGFEFSIPVHWEAVDSSANGDGYFIDAGNDEVDLRIYAEIIPEGNSMDIIPPQCDSLSSFAFNDGIIGKICDVNPQEIFIFRDNPENRLSLFVHAPEDWIESNTELINAVAKSLAFTRN